MAVKLHRCGNTWFKIGGHPCWKVQKALDDQGIEYEIVKGPLSRSKRTDLIEHTHQNRFPAIELEDATWYREDSNDMAQRISKGELIRAAHEPVPESEWMPQEKQTAEEQEALRLEREAEAERVQIERGSEQWQG
jgi:glutathione S-transferase